MAKEPESWTMDTIVKKSTPPPNTEPKAAPKTHAQLAKQQRQLDEAGERNNHKEKKMAKSNGNGNIASISMHYKKETPGTYVYEADDPDAVIPSLYIKKAALPKGKLDKITIKVDAV